MNKEQNIRIVIPKLIIVLHDVKEMNGGKVYINADSIVSWNDTDDGTLVRLTNGDSFKARSSEWTAEKLSEALQNIKAECKIQTDDENTLSE